MKVKDALMSEIITEKKIQNFQNWRLFEDGVQTKKLK